MGFPEKLALLRQKYGMTQEQVARAIGVTRQAVSRWETGTSLPDSVALLKLAEEFDVEPEWLMDDARGGEPEARRVKKGQFTMADRVCLALGAASAIWYAVSLVLSTNGTFVRWMLDPETEGAYRAFMLVNWLVLMPWLRFIPGWLAGALVCRYIALPERKVRVFCRKLGWLCLTPYAVLLGLAVLVRAAGLDYSSPVAAVYNGIINHPAYMIIPGALLSLARRRPPVKAEQ